MYSLDCNPGDIISYKGLLSPDEVFLVLKNFLHTKLSLLNIRNFDVEEFDIKDDAIVYRHIEPEDIEKFLIGGNN